MSRLLYRNTFVTLVVLLSFGCGANQGSESVVNSKTEEQVSERGKTKDGDNLTSAKVLNAKNAMKTNLPSCDGISAGYFLGHLSKTVAKKKAMTSDSPNKNYCLSKKGQVLITTKSVTLIPKEKADINKTNRPSLKLTDFKVRGVLSKEVIRRVIKKHINKVKGCYESRLIQVPKLQEHLVVKFVIGGDGIVLSTEIRKVDSTLNDNKVETCVVDVVRSMQFPEPEGGGIVMVTYPFIFNS